MRDLNHKRSEFALDRIKEMEERQWGKDLKPLIQALPSLIRTNGLGNAMIYLKHVKSKNITASYLYQQAISKWLVEQDLLQSDTDLIHHIQTADQIWYMEAKEESYKLANILRYVYTQLFEK